VKVETSGLAGTLPFAATTAAASAADLTLGRGVAGGRRGPMVVPWRELRAEPEPRRDLRLARRASPGAAGPTRA
jgi:hypothetical protein